MTYSPVTGLSVTTSSVSSCRRIEVRTCRTSIAVAILLLSSCFNRSSIADFKAGFSRFSCPWTRAAFLLYPAFIAASVAFPQMMYSSINFRCFIVNLAIFHHLQSKKPHDCVTVCILGQSDMQFSDLIEPRTSQGLLALDTGTAGIEPAHSVTPWTSHGLAQGATLANFQSWLMFPEGECGIRTHGPHVGGHPSSKRAHSTNSANSPCQGRLTALPLFLDTTILADFRLHACTVTIIYYQF